MQKYYRYAQIIIYFIFLVAIIVVVLCYLHENIINRIRIRRFNKRFDWLVKNKEKLPLSDEEKNILNEKNRNFVAIDEEFYKKMKRSIKRKV